MQDITLESLLRQYMNNSLAGLFTAMPARITQVVNAGEQRVDVQPLVSKVTTDDVTRPHPVILSVPLIYPGSNSSQLSFPVDIGDTVLLVFSQRSIDRFKSGAETPHKPISFRKMSRQDAIAIPGLYSFPEAANQPSKRKLDHSVEDAVIAHNIGVPQENELRLKKSGDIKLTSPKVFTIDADVVINGELSINSPSVTHNGVDIGETHIHNGDSGGTTSPPIGSSSSGVSTVVDGGAF